MKASRTHVLEIVTAAAALQFVVSPATVAQACGSEVLHHKLDAYAAGTGPALRAPDGAAVVGGPFSLIVERAAPFQVGALVFSPVEAPFFDPSYGALFHFGLPYDTIFFGTDADGASPPIVGVDPVDASLCGGFAVFQAGVFDPSAPGGVAVTNAIRLRVGAVTRPLFEPSIEGALELFTDVAAGDVDGDGLEDLIRASGDVQVRIASAGGGFGIPIVYSEGAGTALAPQLADLDGNGTTDFLTADTWGSALTAVLLDGAQAVSSSASYTTTSAPTDLAIADFDLDGEIDAIASRKVGNDLLLFEGAGAGTFAAPQSIPLAVQPIQVEAADLDQDGKLDFVASAGATVVGLGDGAGGFSVAAPDGPVGLFGLDVIDIDDDGHLDVVGRSGNTVAIQRGNGDGTLQAWYGFSESVTLGRVVFSDLDGDGLPEALTRLDGVLDTGYVSVRQGQASGIFAPPVTYGTLAAPTSLTTVDADRDGSPDVLMVGGLGLRGMATLRGLGDGTLLAPRLHEVGGNLREIQTADLDRDGYDDLVLLANGEDEVVVVRNGPTGPTITQRLDTVPYARGLALADLDGDGFQDAVAAQGKNSSQYQVLLGDGAGGFTYAAPVPGPFEVQDIGVGDFDEDGALDLAFVGSQSKIVFGYGDGTFGPEIGAPLATSDRASIAVADVDGDGHLDLASADGLTSYMAVAFGAGDGSFPSVAVIQDDIAAASLIDPRDVDGDGLLDFLAIEAPVGGTHLLTVRRNAGSRTFAPVWSTPIGASHGGAVVLDFDGDGVLDIAVNEQVVVGGGAFMRLLTGAGDGTFGTSLSVPTGTSAGGLAAADVDGDDLPDLVRLQGGSAAWYLLNQLGE